MMRGRSYFDTERARIEIIPMIDIMMFLLIFFIMITLKMIAGAGIKLELPGSSTAQNFDQTRIKVTIGVGKEGQYAVDGAPSDAAGITAALTRAKAEAGATDKVDVIIAGDKGLPLQLLLKTMDIVRVQGITAVGIAARADGVPTQ